MAGPALDDAGSPSTPDPDQPKETPVEYGVGFRVRGIFIPKAEIELFVDRAGDNGSKTLGLGVDFTRRRGNVELQLGIEWEGFNPGKGVWIESGKNVANGDPVDVVPARKDQREPLGWITVEFTFLNHAPITKNLSVRYGGGAGLGIVRGKLEHYDINSCPPGASNAMPDPCLPNVPPFNGPNTNFDPNLVKYKIPPVFPVLNGIIGLQFKPTEKLTINLEGGIRTVLFMGLSSSYFF